MTLTGGHCHTFNGGRDIPRVRGQAIFYWARKSGISIPGRPPPLLAFVPLPEPAPADASNGGGSLREYPPLLRYWYSPHTPWLTRDSRVAQWLHGAAFQRLGSSQTACHPTFSFS